MFSYSFSIIVCVPILTNVPNHFNFQRIIFCPELYMDKSFSLIKLAVIMCESVLDMKDWKRDVLTCGIAELLYLNF